MTIATTTCTITTAGRAMISSAMARPRRSCTPRTPCPQLGGECGAVVRESGKHRQRQQRGRRSARSRSRCRRGRSATTRAASVRAARGSSPAPGCAARRGTSRSASERRPPRSGVAGIQPSGPSRAAERTRAGPPLRTRRLAAERRRRHSTSTPDAACRGRCADAPSAPRSSHPSRAGRAPTRPRRTASSRGFSTEGGEDGEQIRATRHHAAERRRRERCGDDQHDQRHRPGT